MKTITKSIKILKATRQNYLKIVNEYDLDALNFIPQKFNNNLIWNFGHALVTQQLLCYKLSGVEMSMDEKLISKYRKGTKPEVSVTQDEIDHLKSVAIDSVVKLKEDHENGIFKSYNSYPTSYGITLNSIEDAIAFNNVHEGMHIGCCLSIIKFLN